MPAEVPHGLRPEILICESTYGVQSHEGQEERERRFVKMVHEIVGRGGKCLLPVFALGKAQELLLILDEYWEAHPGLQEIPILYASSLAKKCLAIYQTYLNMMNPKLRESGKRRNPFVFKFVSNLKDRGGMNGSSDVLNDLEGAGPCVMMASPGMLQNGLSRRLFEAWCTDKRNGVVLPGYSVEGTLAKSILTEPSDIAPLMGGPKLPLRMSVDAVSFSAHVDFIQNATFIDLLKPKYLVLVHGESNEMNRLKMALQQKYCSVDEDEEMLADVSEVQRQPNTPMKIFTPKNCETVTITFVQNRLIKVFGELASEIILENSKNDSTTESAHTATASYIDAVLVGKNFEYQLLKGHELETFTALKTASLRQRLSFSTSCPFYLIMHVLIKNFGPSQVRSNITSASSKETVTSNNYEEEVLQDGNAHESSVVIMDVLLLHYKQGEIILEWTSSPTSDLFADSAMALILSASSSPSSVKLTIKEGGHSHGGHHSGEISKEGGNPCETHDHSKEKETDWGDSFLELLQDSFYDKVARSQKDSDIIEIVHHGSLYSLNISTMVQIYFLCFSSL